MKRVFTCIGGLFLACAMVSVAFAGGIDNKTNWSAEYIRTLNRNAATDFADIAAYNPAGTVKLQEGFSFNASMQYLGKEYANNITFMGSAENSLSDEPSYLPGIFVVYNEDLLSLFGSITVVGGGGKVEFPTGNATTFGAQTDLIGTYGGVPVSDYLKAESYYIGYTLGTAFNVHDMFSFSVGIRYVDAYREAQGTVNISSIPEVPFYYEEEDNGWGGIFGVNIAPNEKLNIGMRYETTTDLDLEATIGSGATLLNANGIYSGVSRPRDLPAIFAMGISYWITPQLRMETNWTHYFNEEANWNGFENLVSDGFDIGIALEYHITESFLASIGYLHTDTGVDPAYMTPENPELDANTLGMGVGIKMSEMLYANLALGYVFYEDDVYVANPLLSVEYEKDILFIAAGLELRFQ